nr:IPT/TIG domain-containing protein [uncultured Macellibacteroides sp.]
MKKLLIVGGLCLLFMQCKNSNDDDAILKPNDPTKPIELTSFFPDSGGVAEQVILRGSNFGINENELRVYFNKKQATVIRTIGDLAYVVAPKLPGDTCIISVVLGKDSMQYNQPFFYKTRVHVSTIAGTPFADEANVDGPLVESRFTRPYYIAVDQEKNIFVGQYPNGSSGSLHRVRMINEEKNTVTTLLQYSTGGYILSGTCSPSSKTIYFPLDGSAQYYEFDPEKQWAPRRVTPIKKSGSGDFDLERKYCLAVCPADNMLYTITTKGELVKINPKTHEAELVMKDILTDKLSYLQAYLTFDPSNPNMLYFVNPSSLNPADGVIPGTDKIYRIDLRRNMLEDYAGSGVKGHLDGPSALAQFNDPCQICFDKDGTLYVGDTDNCCVRKISRDGVVSTVVGIPGKSGYLDGNPDIALLNRFWGMYIDEEGTLYIADYYNNCVRKLTIE